MNGKHCSFSAWFDVNLALALCRRSCWSILRVVVFSVDAGIARNDTYLTIQCDGNKVTISLCQSCPKHVQNIPLFGLSASIRSSHAAAAGHTIKTLLLSPLSGTLALYSPCCFHVNHFPRSLKASCCLPFPQGRGARYTAFSPLQHTSL